MTPYGKKLLLAKDENEFKRLLGISSEGIWDECQNRWTLSGAGRLSTGSQVFGSQSLALPSGAKFITALPALGGKPFTISFFATIPNGAGTVFLGQGVSISSAITTVRNSNDTCVLYMTVGTTKTTVVSKANNAATKLADKAHFEFGYDGTNVYCFLNGALKKTQATTIDRNGCAIQLGGSMVCNIDEVRILDGVCEHTAAFTPPTEPYTLTADTVSLLHFED